MEPVSEISTGGAVFAVAVGIAAWFAGLWFWSKMQEKIFKDGDWNEW